MCIEILPVKNCSSGKGTGIVRPYSQQELHSLFVILFSLSIFMIKSMEPFTP
jgi:hypothetical protein